MPELGLPLVTMIAANAIMSIASALQASVGIGLALLAVPLLALLDPRFVPGPMLLAGSLLALACAHRERHAVDAKSFSLSLLGLATGTLFGAVALRVIGTGHINTIFAIVVLLAVAISVSGLRVQLTRSVLFTGGGVAGVMGTMAGIHGPHCARVSERTARTSPRDAGSVLFCCVYEFRCGSGRVWPVRDSPVEVGSWTAARCRRRSARGTVPRGVHQPCSSARGNTQHLRLECALVIVALRGDAHWQ